MAHHYDMMERINSGSYGTVCRAKKRATGEMRAVKKMEIFVPIAKVMEEVHILTQLNKGDTDGLIIKFHGMYMDRGRSHLIFDLINFGDLSAWMWRFYPYGMPLCQLKILVRKMLYAFSYLQSHHIVHGDVKQENLLMASPNPASLKICDFGMARVIPPCYGHGVIHPSLTAAISYRAPEVILGYSSTYAQSPDMWAVGCIIMELVANRPLFASHNTSVDDFGQSVEVLQQQCSAVCKPPPHMLDTSRELWLGLHLKRTTNYPEYVSCYPLLPTLIDMLHRQRRNRIQEVINLHHLIIRFLSMDPNVRMSPNMALVHAFLQ